MKKNLRRWALLAAAVLVVGAAALGIYQFAPGKAPLARALKQQLVLLTPQSTAPTGRGAPLALINREHPCPSAPPDGLINLYAQKERGFALASSQIELTGETFQAAKAMFAAAARDGVEGFILSSGYRDRQAQQAEYEAQPTLAALPGASEHESGTAFDVTAYGHRDFTRTPQYAWLYDNCWDYGFILRYPSDKTQVTGTPAESWHYRYVGLPHSRIMGELGLCLEEYMDYVHARGVLRAEYDGQAWLIEADGPGVIRAYAAPQP